jgi:deoxyguanosine kinase
MRHTFVAIEGPIGVGKTSLAELLARRFDDSMVILESISNPFLSDFYKDIPGSAIRTQIHFLLSRYEQLKGLSQRELFRKRVISDFMFAKDKIFAYLTLSDSELVLYEKLYEMLAPQVPTPDMVVYLTADAETLKKRIRARGRAFEKDIELEYLKEVNRAYNYFFFNYSLTPLLVVNTDEFDFVHSDEDLTDLIQQIDSTERGTRYYVPRR